MLQKEIDLYLKWKSGNYPRAAKMYEIHVRRFNEYNKKALSEITIENVIDFNESIKNKYSQNHINYAMTVVKDFLGFYYKQTVKGKRRCNIDPSLVRIRRNEANPHYAITEKEYRELINKMPENEFWHAQLKIIVRLLYETGIRVSELVNLNIEDIDNPNHMALIITRKGREKGWIKWSDDLHETMVKFLGVRLCMNQQPHLFLTSTGHKRPTVRTIERWVKKIVREYDMDERIVVHSFRHGKAHYMYDHGADLVAVHKALRHSKNNVGGAMQYLRFNEKESDKILTEFLPVTY